MNDLDDDSADVADAFAPDPNPEPGLTAKAADAFVWIALGLITYVATCAALGAGLARLHDHLA